MPTDYSICRAPLQRCMDLEIHLNQFCLATGSNDDYQARRKAYAAIVDAMCFADKNGLSEGLTELLGPASQIWRIELLRDVEATMRCFEVMGHAFSGVDREKVDRLVERISDRVQTLSVAIGYRPNCFQEHVWPETGRAEVKDDTKDDMGKNSHKKKRDMTKAARSCVTIYRRLRKAGDKVSMEYVVRDYAHEHGESFSGIKRVLADNPDEWKNDRKHDTNTTR